MIALDAVEISVGEIINARRAYYGNVTYVDEWLGRILNTLHECGMAENTTILFTSDHGDMLGEFGLWYKMSFREWACRIPLIIHNPARYSSRRVSEPTALVDVLPTLIEIAHEGLGTTKLPPIIPLNGRSLIRLCDGNSEGDSNMAVSEYLAEGTGEPMLMIRRGAYKYITCPSDPDQLFNLEKDPDELQNLANSTEESKTLEEFQEKAAKYWDVERIKQLVIKDQERRQFIHSALCKGQYKSWDFEPKRDSNNEYTRSHLNLSKFDTVSRYPRPEMLKTRGK